MPTASQLWFVTKKAAIVIGVLAIAHLVGAPRGCGGCGLKASGKSQVSSNPALGGPDTKTIGKAGKATKKGSLKATTGLINPPEPDKSAGPQPHLNSRMDAPRFNMPGGIGGGRIR